MEDLERQTSHPLKRNKNHLAPVDEFDISYTLILIFSLIILMTSSYILVIGIFFSTHGMAHLWDDNGLEIILP